MELLYQKNFPLQGQSNSFSLQGHMRCLYSLLDLCVFVKFHEMQCCIVLGHCLDPSQNGITAFTVLSVKT